MQSGYGGVSEFQQFIMDGAFAAMSAPPPPPQQASQPPAPAAGQEPFRYQPLHHHALPPQHHHHHHHAPPMPPHFAHFAGGGGIPFTQQLLHQAAAAHPHLQLFQEQHHQKPTQQPTRWAPQQQHHHHPNPHPHPHHHHPHHHHHLGFDVEAAVPESSGAAAGGSTASGGGGGVPSFLMNFKLGVDAGGGSGATGGTDDALNDGGGGSGIMLDEAATESRLRRWTGDEETSIKEPTWRPLDIDYLHSSTSSSKKEKAATPELESPPAAAANYSLKKGQGGGDDDNAAAASTAGAAANYKLFSELEAIYKPGSGGAQTGSGSGLTGDDNAAILAEPSAMPADLPGPDATQQQLNNTSEGEDVAAVVVEPPPQQQQPPQVSSRKRKRRRQEQLQSASASFFERLVQRLMEHQESLHRQFLDAMERRERERAARDEAWRRQEADKFAREAAARAQDRASAAAREAAIIAYLEKLSGETITLPPAPAGDDQQDKDTMMEGVDAHLHYKADKDKDNLMMSTSSRWPKHEVEALIRVRTGLEGRFQEPGLKGPLWEEVSSRMAAAGYGRSAKRCKEKWENINKYFRKAKESGKKRPSQAKTCPYFDELDRLYSRSSNAANADDGKASSELLDAVVKYPEGPPGFVLDTRDHQNNAEAITKNNNQEAEEDGNKRQDDAGDGEDDGRGREEQVEESQDGGDDDHH